MRRLFAIATVVLVVGSGCGSSSSGDTDADPESSPTPAAVETPTEHVAVTAPFELDLEAPEGFALGDGDRDDLVTDEHVTYEFLLTGANEYSRLFVTAYLLPEDVETGDYESQVEVVLAYDRDRGNTISEDKHTSTLVQGYHGVYRFAQYELDGEEVSQQNHYLFADRHLIQITCQWKYDFNQVYQGCKDLTTAFSYPSEWPLAY